MATIVNKYSDMYTVQRSIQKAKVNSDYKFLSYMYLSVVNNQKTLTIISFSDTLYVKPLCFGESYRLVYLIKNLKR